jgi:periplasmic copper chaperone A
MLEILKNKALILISVVFMGSAFAQSPNPTLLIQEQHVRATLPGQKMSSAYLTIENRGSAPDRLVSVTYAGAKEVQIHEMKMVGNTMSMRQLNGLEIPANGKAVLSSGGNHLMLMDLKDAIQDGQNIKMTLQFEKAGKVTVDFPAKAMNSHMH